MPINAPSLWTEEDQKQLAELVRKRGFARTALGLRNIADARTKLPRIASKADWDRISGLLVRIYDNITEGRKIE